jgi:hypothetical protein
MSREDAILRLYKNRLAEFGGFQSVKSIQVLKPTSDRTYFHLVYGTRHIKGIEEFAAVEKKFVSAQERVRLDAKKTAQEQRTKQIGLFSGEDLPPSQRWYDAQRARQLKAASEMLLVHIRRENRAAYADVLALLLPMSLIWESDVKDILENLTASGQVTLEGLAPRQRRAAKGCYVVATEIRAPDAFPRV